MIKILILDKQAIFKAGIKAIISNYQHFNIVGDFEFPSQLIAKLKEVQADIILSDIIINELDAFEFIVRIKKEFPFVKIAIITNSLQESYLAKAIELGIDGYLHKSVPENELIEAIQLIQNNEKYFSKDFASMAAHFTQNIASNTKANLLSEREKEILIFIANGFKNKEIADKLFISSKTVDNHRANILKKLILKNNAQLTRYAIEQKLI